MDENDGKLKDIKFQAVIAFIEKYKGIGWYASMISGNSKSNNDNNMTNKNSNVVLPSVVSETPPGTMTIINQATPNTPIDNNDLERQRLRQEYLFDEHLRARLGEVAEHDGLRAARLRGRERYDFRHPFPLDRDTRGPEEGLDGDSDSDGDDDYGAATATVRPPLRVPAPMGEMRIDRATTEVVERIAMDRRATRLGFVPGQFFSCVSKTLLSNLCEQLLCGCWANREELTGGVGQCVHHGRQEVKFFMADNTEVQSNVLFRTLVAGYNGDREAIVRLDNMRGVISGETAFTDLAATRLASSGENTGGIVGDLVISSGASSSLNTSTLPSMITSAAIEPLGEAGVNRFAALETVQRQQAAELQTANQNLARINDTINNLSNILTANNNLNTDERNRLVDDFRKAIIDGSRIHKEALRDIFARPGDRTSTVISGDDLSIICISCCNVFRNPVSLPCGHSFCSQCEQTYYNTRDIEWGSRNGVPCPLCKKNYRRPPEGFPVNNVIKNSIQALQNAGVLNEEGQLSIIEAEEDRTMALRNRRPADAVVPIAAPPVVNVPAPVVNVPPPIVNIPAPIDYNEQFRRVIRELITIAAKLDINKGLPVGDMQKLENIIKTSSKDLSDRVVEALENRVVQKIREGAEADTNTIVNAINARNIDQVVPDLAAIGDPRSRSSTINRLDDTFNESFHDTDTTFLGNDALNVTVHENRGTDRTYDIPPPPAAPSAMNLIDEAAAAQTTRILSTIEASIKKYELWQDESLKGFDKQSKLIDNIVSRLPEIRPMDPNIITQLTEISNSLKARVEARDTSNIAITQTITGDAISAVIQHTLNTGAGITSAQHSTNIVKEIKDACAAIIQENVNNNSTIRGYIDEIKTVVKNQAAEQSQLRSDVKGLLETHNQTLEVIKNNLTTLATQPTTSAEDVSRLQAAIATLSVTQNQFDRVAGFLNGAVLPDVDSNISLSAYNQGWQLGYNKNIIESIGNSMGATTRELQELLKAECLKAHSQVFQSVLKGIDEAYSVTSVVNKEINEARDRQLAAIQANTIIRPNAQPMETNAQQSLQDQILRYEKEAQDRDSKMTELFRLNSINQKKVEELTQHLNTASMDKNQMAAKIKELQDAYQQQGTQAASTISALRQDQTYLTAQQEALLRSTQQQTALAIKATDTTEAIIKQIDDQKRNHITNILQLTNANAINHDLHHQIQRDITGVHEDTMILRILYERCAGVAKQLLNASTNSNQQVQQYMIDNELINQIRQSIAQISAMTGESLTPHERLLSILKPQTNLSSALNEINTNINNRFRFMQNLNNKIGLLQNQYNHLQNKVIYATQKERDMAILNYKNNLNLIRNDIISDVQAITGQPRQKIKYPEIQIDPNVFPPVAALPQVNKPTVSTRSNVSSAITNPQIYQPSNQSTITNSQMSGPPQSVTEINSQMSGPPRSVTEINSQMPARSTVSSFQQIAAASNPTIAPPNRNLQDVQNYVNNLDINTYDNDSASTISRSSNLSGTLISAVPTSATRYDYMPIQGATNELDTKIPFKRKELNKNNRNRFFNNQDVEEPDYEDYEPKVQVIEERDEEEIKESKMLHKKLLEDMFQLQLSNAKPITNKDLKNKIANIDTILKRLEKISDNQEQVKSFSKSYQQMVKQYTDFAKSNKDLQDNSTLILNKGSIPIQLGNPTTGKQSNTTVIDRPQVKIADKTGTLLPVVDQVSSDGVNTTVNMNETLLTTTDLNQTVPLEETGKRQEDSTQSIESTETNKATPVTANPVAPASVVAPAPAPAPAAVADEPAAVPLTSDKALDNLVNTTSPSTIEAAKSMPTVPYTSTSIDDHRDNVDKVDKVLPTPIPATTIPATPIPTTVSNVGSAASTISSAVAQPFVEPDYIREPDVTVPPLRQKVEQQGDSRIKSYIRDLGITKVGEMGMIKDLVTNDLMKMSPEEREDSKYFYDLMDTHHASMSKIFETMLKDAGKPAFRDYNLNLDTEQLYRKPNLWNPLRQEFDNDMKEYMQKLQKVDKSSPDYPRVKNWERILQNVQYKLHNQAKKYFNDLSLVNQHMTKLRRFPGEQSESLTLPSHSYKDPSAKSDPSTKSDSSAKSMSYSQAASTAPTNPTSSNVDKLNAFLRAPREGFKKPEVPPPTAAQTTNRSRSAAKTEPTPLLNLNRTPSTESEKAKKLVYHNNKNKSKGSRHGHGITTGEKSKFHYKQLPHLCNHEFANHPVRLGIIKKVMQNYHHENAHLQNNQQRYITNLNNLLQPLLHALEDINLDVYIQHKDKRQKENLDLMRIEKVKKKGEGIKCCHCETKKDLRVTNTAPYETCCTNCMKGKGITKNRRMINMNNTSNLAETTAPEHETLSNAYNTYLRQDDSPPENKEENNNTTPTESLWRQFVKSVPEDIRKRIGHTLSKYKTKDEFEDENFYALIKNNPLTYLDDITLCLAYLFNHRTKYHEKQDLSLLKENVKTMLMAYSEGKNVKSVNHKANIQYEKFHDFSSAYNYLKNNPSLCMTIQAFL